MLEALQRGWWFLVLRGVFAVLFGVLTFVWPGITLVTLVLLFGAYALVNGICTLGVALRGGKGAPGKATLVLLGLLGVAAGVLTFFYPGITALSLLVVIAWWAIVTGIFEIAAAVKLRKQMSNEWLLVLSGALSVIFGVLLIAMPSAGALSIVWLIGAYALLFGVLMLALAVKLKGVLTQARGATPLPS
jgi:uncharacterized membrane protein HdeD (DUF308 family)